MLPGSTLSESNKGLVYISLSAALFSVMGVFVKHCTISGIPALELVAIRTVFQGLITALCLYVLRSDSPARVGEAGAKANRRLLTRPFGGTSAVQRVVLARGIIGGFGLSCYFYTVSALPLGDAITLMTLYPFVTLLAARVVLAERMTLVQVAACAGTALGATLIAQPSFLFPDRQQQQGTAELNGTVTVAPAASINPLGYASAAGGSLAGGAVFVLMRKAGTLGVHPLQLLMSWATFGFFISVAVSVFSSLEKPWVMPAAGDWGNVMGVCIAGASGHFFMNFGGTMAPAGLGSIFRSADVVYAYVMEILVFHVAPNGATVSGALLVMVAVVAVGVEKWRTSPASGAGQKGRGGQALVHAAALTRLDAGRRSMATELLSADAIAVTTEPEEAGGRIGGGGGGGDGAAAGDTCMH